MDSKEKKPPEDFRSLSITPTIKDLQDKNPYLRSCKIDEPYDSVDHYLDVQFRLLREDFISPLRRGLNEYINHGQKFKNSDLRVYKNVKLVSSEVDIKKNNLGIKVFFGVLKKVNWEDSKRFTPGGLLLLSCDNFNSIIFATILDTDKKKLQKGYILIELVEERVISRQMYKAKYTMLESRIYFEPYKAVLSAMQLMNRTNFPMETHLVNASGSSRLPKYLQNRSLFSEIDTPWQVNQKRKLDVSQYNAFKHALSEEFALIQGPPGTGKTFIALEIVQALLLNKLRWSNYGPIVVVCFTNHALDQFLEGILKYTQSVIRIGERSKSEALQPFTLRQQRQLAIKNRNSWDGNAMARRELSEGKKNLGLILAELSSVNSIIDHLTTKEAIVPFEILTLYCQDESLRNMRSNENLVKWLTEGTLSSSVLQKLENIRLDNQFFEDTLNASAQHNAEDYEQMDDFLELDDDFELDVPQGNNIIYPVKDIDLKLAMIDKRIELLRNEGFLNKDPLTLKHCQTEIYHLELHKERLVEDRENLKMEFLKHPIVYSDEEPSHHYRWNMYWNWIKESYDVAAHHLNEFKKVYYQQNRALNEAKQIVDLGILKKREIIGLTTTAAARLHVTLNGLHAPIVIVEEAAEILESHIVCSMTRHCQHVILIGDHKQLRPKPSDYMIGKDYNLEVSLFERMVNIRGDCNQLVKQHRMRPEIVKLIIPSIYSTLENDKTVYDFPNVKGLEKNLFFLNHESPEDKHTDESYVNKFEAEFLIKFATHLVMQGYETKDISILSTYMGQMFELKKEKNKFPILKELYITTVDNYQGEENKIILLSLVRNNGEGNIGFLKEENRVCVALSRAREGLYIMGNIDDLVKRNRIWPKIKKVLEDQEAIGESITLRCQNHTDQIINVKNPNDFQQCPEGGCLKICNYQLDCGHTCTNFCHILDKEHLKYKCEQSCGKSCPEGHPCPLKCWEDCKPYCDFKVKCVLKKCGHEVEKSCFVDPDEFRCYHKVKVILPDCNHEVEKPCFLPIERCICTHPCEYRVDLCGHSCLLKCHVNQDPDHLEYKCRKECPKECESGHQCTKLCYEDCGPCLFKMKKERSCGHFFPNALCSDKVEEIICERPCKRILRCGHSCSMKCFESCGNNCQQKVVKTSTCGHEVTLKCCEEATPARCNGPCLKKLSCGHPCNARCKDLCTTRCEAKVRLSQPGLCGHIFSVPCYLRNNDPKNLDLLKYCDEPCQTVLECKHVCDGTCGKCFQGRIHVQCKKPCSRILICGHQCPMLCREECQPCKKPCEIRCVHSKCNKKCGSPCGLCNEKCALGCEHQKCTKRCSQLCDIKPCDEPCKKLLKCKHPCVGFCGEPCPPLCRICDEDKFKEALLDDSDIEHKSEARLVYLEKCGHCVESNELLKWMETSNASVGMKLCPKCNSPIIKCARIINKIKELQNDVMRVKEKTFLNDKNKNFREIQQRCVEVLKEINESRLVSEFKELKTSSQKLVSEICSPLKKNQSFSIQELINSFANAFEIKTNIFQRVWEMLSSMKNQNALTEKLVREQVSLIANSISDEWSITQQNFEDLQLELTRLHYLIKICNEMANQPELESALKHVSSIDRFTKEYEEKVIDQLQKLNFNIKMERELIYKEINVNQARWFNCPSGHVYMMTSVTEEGRCNECH